MHTKMEKTETLPEQPGEKTIAWDDLTEGQQYAVAFVLAKGLQSTPRKLQPLLNVGKPQIIFGAGFKYCRIHPDSVDVMTVIIREYL